MEKYKGFFICPELNHKIIIYTNAIPDLEWGYICDCGRWTKDTKFIEVVE